MTVIENINVAYVSQDLSLLSSADVDTGHFKCHTMECVLYPFLNNHHSFNEHTARLL